MATLTVTTLADTFDFTDTFLSLREAIALANSNTGTDSIVFAPDLLGGMIHLSQALSALVIG